jgi:hypothetical protein
MKKFNHEVSEENALKAWEWLQSRKGIAIWKSVNLSNPGGSWSTPATIRRGDCEGNVDDDDEIIAYPKPTWEAEDTPTIITDPAEVGVFTCALYKAFRVGLRMGDGLSLRLTDGAQRKVDRYLAECKEKHGDSFYRKGVLDIDGASIGIYCTTGIIPIAVWIAKQPKEVAS